MITLAVLDNSGEVVHESLHVSWFSAEFSLGFFLLESTDKHKDWCIINSDNQFASLAIFSDDVEPIYWVEIIL